MELPRDVPGPVPPPEPESGRDESKEFKKALTYLKMGQLDRARETLEAYIQLNPDSLKAMNKYAFVLLELNKSRAAKYVLQNLIAKGHRDFYTHFLLGRAFHREGNFQVAIQQYRNALALKPDDVYTLNGLAQALRESGQGPAAVALLARALGVSHEDPTTFQQLTELYLELGDTGSAGKWADQGLAEHSGDLRLRCLRAEVYLRGGELDTARTAYEQLARDFPSSAEGKLGLARVLDRVGRPQEAIRELGLAFAVESKNTAVSLEQARILAKSGDLDGAEASLQRASELAPKDYRVLADLADVLIQKKLKLRAYMTLKKAVALRNNYHLSHYLIGRLFLDEELYSQARDELEFAHKLAPDHLPCRGVLAEALVRTGALDEAMEHARALLQLDSTNRQAQLVTALIELARNGTAATARLAELAREHDRVAIVARAALDEPTR
ncbi:MAG: tetratricopeptide repeat protein [Candidatus Riflebacteria bacterium]|nr:tetratricopeptide repeat protein [Candidatus Riflebacteria bacterium]